MDEDDIGKLFGEANRDGMKVDGRPVLNESEFITIYHKLLERPGLADLFEKITVKYKGLAITQNELQQFLREEQGYELGLDECKQIIMDYEVNTQEDRERRKTFNNLYLSYKGFLRLATSSTLFYVKNRVMIENVYQVSRAVILSSFCHAVIL